MVQAATAAGNATPGGGADLRAQFQFWPPIALKTPHQSLRYANDLRLSLNLI